MKEFSELIRILTSDSDSPNLYNERILRIDSNSDFDFGFGFEVYVEGYDFQLLPIASLEKAYEE